MKKTKEEIKAWIEGLTDEELLERYYKNAVNLDRWGINNHNYDLDILVLIDTLAGKEILNRMHK